MAAISAILPLLRRRPLSSAAWNARLLLSAGLLISMAVHVALLGTVVFVQPSAKEAPPPKSIAVDLVPAKEAPPVAKQEKPKQEKPKPETPKPEQTAREPSKPEQPPAPAATAAPPQPAPKTKPASAPKPAPAQAQAQPWAPRLAPAPKPAPQAPAPGKASKPAQTSAPPPPSANTDSATVDASATAARLAEMLNLTELDPTVPFEAPPSENRARLSPGEIAAFKAQLQKCWQPPAGVPPTEKVKVVLRISLNRKGALTREPALLAGSPSRHGPALYKSALATLARCQPFTTLPAKKYQEWKRLDLNFTPADVVDVGSGAGFSAPRMTR